MGKMHNGYDFAVEAVEPSGLLSYQSGKGKSERQFRLQCRNAEEFALRQIGKFWTAATEFSEEYVLPVLPAPFPFNGNALVGDEVLNYGRMNLVATSFSIRPATKCCFNANGIARVGDPVYYSDWKVISDPADLTQMERYFKSSPGDDDDVETWDADEANVECLCVVTIGYEENPCDCAIFVTNSLSEYYGEWQVNEYILPGTCISIERNPAYEMVTLPNGNLIWADLPPGTPKQDAARRLLPDSYAYMIVPKADIIISWHNVPVAHLCQIENHLKQFRGHVNEVHWGDEINCDAERVDPEACEGCGQYEPETILFVDWQEDRSKRTDCFGGTSGAFATTSYNMNTTTLKLTFKQKRVERPTTASYSDSDPCPDNNDLAFGWNHLFHDREPADGIDEWARVVVESTGEPIFPTAQFNLIFYPTI